jgi:hypothetical protein
VRVHALQQVIVPQPVGLDIEFAFQLLIDRLHSVAGHGPLPADPIDVAMQGHVIGGSSRRLQPRISGAAGRARLRNIFHGPKGMDCAE